jgi:hypothetical protein
MNFRCSKHVEREMARRGISRDIVDGVLTAPAPKVPERAGILSKRRGDRPEPLPGAASW